MSRFRATKEQRSLIVGWLRGNSRRLGGLSNVVIAKKAAISLGFPVTLKCIRDARDECGVQPFVHGSKGGRPPISQPGKLKERKDKLKPLALEMLASGKSQRGVAVELGLPISTLRKWL